MQRTVVEVGSNIMLQRTAEDAGSLSTQASEWVDQMKGNPDEKTREEFAEWLGQSLNNMEAFLAMSDLDSVLANVDPEGDYTVEDLCASESTEVVDLHTHTPMQPAHEVAPSLGDARVLPMRPVYRSSSRYALGGAAAVAIGLIGVAALAWRPNTPAWKDYVAAEQPRSIPMPDGSEALLESHSHLRLLFDKEHRAIRLIEGSARFDVEHEQARPFDVLLDKDGHRKVRAVGTEFDVARDRRDKRVASVTVLKGQVKIIQRTGKTTPDKIEFVDAGERAKILADGRIQRELTVATPLPAMLDLRDRTLEQVESELNRTGELPRLVVHGPARQRKVWLYVTVNDRSGVIEYLKQQPDLQVSEGPKEVDVRFADRGAREEVESNRND